MSVINVGNYQDVSNSLNGNYNATTGQFHVIVKDDTHNVGLESIQTDDLFILPLISYSSSSEIAHPTITAPSGWTRTGWVGPLYEEITGLYLYRFIEYYVHRVTGADDKDFIFSVSDPAKYDYYGSFCVSSFRGVSDYHFAPASRIMAAYNATSPSLTAQVNSELLAAYFTASPTNASLGYNMSVEIPSGWSQASIQYTDTEYSQKAYLPSVVATDNWGDLRAIYTALRMSGVTSNVTVNWGVTNPASWSVAMFGLLPSGTATHEVSIAIQPMIGNCGLNGTYQFSAAVYESVDQTVNWSVVEENGGSITSDGLYTAPATAGVYHVKAALPSDANKYATAAITVTDNEASTFRLQFKRIGIV
ncbi:MAG: hypothetical protein HF312_15435 [Ignavibacteria bacterium]|jgi:hypothetical protein|nr:hypothetical protein [Ignavibacteria bacterium]